MAVDRSSSVERADPAPRSSDGPPAWAFLPPVVVGIVLRWWRLGSNGLSADEMFTGVHALEPFFSVIGRTADDDIHPPLDALLRNPVAGLHDNLALRTPSALLATATLLLVWYWGRRRGWLGLWFVTLTAISSFELLYGRTARPYALLVLCGTVVAFAADSWLRESRTTRWAAVAAIATLAALFTDSTGGLLVLGGFLLPGLRRDRAAWIWRSALVAAGVVFAAAWSWVTLRHYQDPAGAGYIALADPAYAVREVGRLAAVFYPDNGFVLVPLFVVGAVALLRIDRPLTRVLVTLSLVPIGFAALAGFEFRFLLVRSLSSVSWGIPLALAALVEWGRRRGVAYAALVLVALAILVVPSVPYALSYDEEVQSAAAYLHTVVEPGDGVIVFPGALSHIVEWSLDLPEHGTGIPGYDNPERQTDPKRAYATVAPGAAFSGRVFVLGAQGTVPALPGTPCPSLEPRTFADVYTVSCRQLTG